MLISKPILTQIKNSQSSIAKTNMPIFQMVTFDGGVLGLFGVKDLRGAQK